MMKWLRAHNKQIMAAVVLLAMFSFIGGSALVALIAPNPLKDPFGVALGSTVSLGEIQEAQADVSVLDTLFGQQDPNAPRRWQFGQRGFAVHHWYMLLKEAEKAGIVVSDAEIDAQLQQIPADFLESLRIQYRITPPAIRKALSNYMMIIKNSSRIGTAATPSDPQVRHYVHDTQDKVKVRFVTVDAKQFVDKTAPVSEAEAKAQFEANKDKLADSSESGFGYKYPRRVKLQYIVASIPEIAPQMNVSLDAVKSYWKSNRSKYKKTIYEQPVSTQPTASAPAPEPRVVEKSFSEAQPDIEREMRQKSALQVADQAMRKAHEHLIRPWVEITPGEDGFKAIPDAAKDLQVFRAASDKFSREFGISLKYGETGLVTLQEIMENADLRGAALGSQSRGGLSITEYAFRVPGFYKPEGASDSEPCLQLFQPPEGSLVAETFQYLNNQFVQVPQRVVLFRVVEAVDSAAPGDLSEVRQKVEDDVRLKQAFQRAEAVAREVLAVAARLGLDAVPDIFKALADEKKISAVTAPAPFARELRLSPERYLAAEKAGEPTKIPPTVQGVGASNEFVSACFEMADKGWKTDAPPVPAEGAAAAATTRPALEPAPAVRLVPLPNQHLLAIVEYVGMESIDQVKFDTEIRQAAYDALMRERFIVLYSEWFDPQKIEQRCAFKREEGAQLPPIGGYQQNDTPPPFAY